VASLSGNTYAPLSSGLRSGATFVAALGAAGILAQFTQAPPIFLALAASLVVTGIARVLAAEEPFDANYSSRGQAPTHVVSFVVALLGLWGIVNVVPATRTFVCEPLVPWRLSIAAFGAFSMSWLAEATKIRMSYSHARLMIHLAFFWIAPFYGFFHAPWFLAQAVALPCDGRPLPQALVAGLAMVVAAYGGNRAAGWMFGQDVSE
jgi:hypothetical protein